ncbi:MAG: hypothetical protein GVY16_10980 [Planctomycetes bacterium]|jgi:hypothetical protein|nr:hypothetical protein [Planctomycetota bacterium]
MQKAVDSLFSRQNTDGGWGYRPHLTSNSDPSMTVAGIASPYVAVGNLDRKDFRGCNRGVTHPRVETGMQWLGRRM